MRCSPRLCIGLVAIAIGGAIFLGHSGNAQAAYLLSFLPLLACPLMCIIMLMTGRKCESDDCQVGRNRNSESRKRF